MLEESIRAYMAARGSVFEARVFDCVDSTNTVLAALARSGAPEFTAVIAGAQTAGRGRGEHRFFSPAGCGGREAEQKQDAAAGCLCSA